MATTNQYRPDYAVPPGWVLEERLEVQGISQAEFARLCGCSPKLISEIVSGKAPLEPETARQFEKVLGVDASIWLGLEDAYKPHRPQEAERHLVFISHANPEDNEFASWLGTRLTAAGYEAWTDVLNLKGGEPFWRDIGTVIKEEAAVVVIALSRASYQKDGVLNEIALAVNTGRQLNKQQFIIPIRLDDLPFSDFPEQLIRLNAIGEFSSNWADGFSRLLRALRNIQVPQSTSDVGEALASWQKFKLRQSASISDTPESIFSNWFQISSLPSHIYFSRFKASQEAMECAFNEFQSPTAPYMRLAVSFADTATLQMETPDILLEHAYRVPLPQFLDGQKTNRPQVSWRDARNIVTRLLRQAWEQFARNQGLLLCEFAHGSAWFVPLDMIEGNIATFQDENGKKRRRLVGWSKKRGVYWHFAVSGKVSTSNPRHLTLRPHVVFTQDGKTPLESKARAHRLRRSFCKNWWNDRWRDLLRAFVAALANGKEEFPLSLGGDAVATIAASPMGFDAPLSITENDSVPIAEEDHVEDEAEADALDDFDSALDETDFDDLLDHEDDEYEEGV